MHYHCKENCPLKHGAPSTIALGEEGDLPPPRPSTIAQLLIVAAEVPLSSATLSQRICQGNEVLPSILGTSDKLRHLG